VLFSAQLEPPQTHGHRSAQLVISWRRQIELESGMGGKLTLHCDPLPIDLDVECRRCCPSRGKTCLTALLRSPPIRKRNGRDRFRSRSPLRWLSQSLNSD
jgi:hypothetical protein